jgi:hypothetical protein
MMGTAMCDTEECAEPQPDYLSFLVRLWRMQDGADAWRGSIESPHTGERLGFASLEELFAFLLEQTGAMPGAE